MAGPAASSNSPTLVARSALLTLTATPSDHALALQVSRISDHHLVTGAGKVTATLDGHGVTLTAEPNGTYLLSTRDQGGGAQSLSVIVSHDGIREVLTGTVTLPQKHSALNLLEGHGMFAWWVLNIAVVLIAVLIIARRRR